VANNEVEHYTGRFLGMRERRGWEYTYRTNASGVVVMVPVTDAGELVLVEQYRIPVECRVLELPAGLAGDTGDINEDFELAAQRELLEETGYKADFLEKLMTSPSSPGLTDEMVSIYYASGLQKVGAGGGDGNEDITVHLVPLPDAVSWLDKQRHAGFMIDPKIYAALFWAGLRT
jgi:ADP-ribose pyrophosphatase